MIICSELEFELNKICNNGAITDIDCIYKEASFIPIRFASVEEYNNQCQELGVDIPTEIYPYYYKILID